MKPKHFLVIALLAVGALGLEGAAVYRAATVPPPAEALWLFPRLHLVNPNDVRGVYMTAVVAEGRWLGGRGKRDAIMKLVHETELNAVVIDVKESEGSQLSEGIKKFVASLKDEAVWKIARITTFADNSQIAAHPDWYLQRTGGGVWRDNRNNAWLDPAVPEARLYIIEFAQTVIDAGFDELQFDYIRYPSDGTVSAIVRTQENRTKRDIIRGFFEELSWALRAYDSSVPLSLDLFGYVTQRPEESIGQALEDAAPFFNYISPMVYPSHYYSGFFVAEDPPRGLPAVSLSAHGANADPHTVVYRSMLTALDTIQTATSSTARRAKLRPWLQNFSLGVHYDANMIRAQIDAAHKAGTQGWMLWNAANRYNKDALNKM